MSVDAIGFSISSWSGWTVGANHPERLDCDAIRFSDVPDASSVPPLLRRRLNFMGRSCVAEMLQHLQAGEDIPIVYCSRHGDIERTLSVLVDLARGEPASPMDFSLAVHNAIAGVLSIHCRITSNISSMATGRGAVVPVLLEAVGMLSAKVPKVLCIICDVALPQIYRTADDADDHPFVACFTVTQAAGTDLRLHYAGAAGTDDCAHDTPLDFIAFLASSSGGLASSSGVFNVWHNGGRWAISRSGST
jgi:hypothetical protein